jgi:hypothetical protein
LAESYEFSEEIIATMMEPMLVLNENLQLKSASTFCRKYSLDKEELEGTSVYEIDNKNGTYLNYGAS